MEVSYIIIPVVEGREEIFNEELSTIFPLAKMKYLRIENQLLLVLYINVEYYLKHKMYSEAELYRAEQDIFVFAHRKPYLKCVFIHMICAGTNCYFEGFVVRNKSVILESSGVKDSYVKLLKEIMPSYYTSDKFEAFSRAFIENT
ncbi:hypothetical protein [Myroides pelagicus]|uniref:Uncharacterized protein n=1 Tax=Myroides pelagicus TaxID=270914 RepID=A0A7K1GPU8_9FLAO|nr:hypothetical protein [Myroides pelagicus]MEC4113866.1 hypothetical protein [Myroides pelagicus]MTH30423.1 hypothetical protein [Myroides pelagicus]